jgi:pimeloyl-ACP methyl ester carboxylesterase
MLIAQPTVDTLRAPDSIRITRFGRSLARIADPERPAPIVNFWYSGRADTAKRAIKNAAPGSAILSHFRHPRQPFALDASSTTGRGTKFPFLLYFPGWAATAVDNIALIKEFAGAGFVVATVHYPADLPGASHWVVLRQREELERPMDFSSARAFAETIERANRRVSDRAADAVAILDALGCPNGSEVDRKIVDQLDADRIGVFGYSLGGAVAAEACVRDNRFRAAINIDGWHFGEAIDRGVSQPYLFISDDTPLPTASDLISPNPVRRFTALLNRQAHERLTSNFTRHGGHLLTLVGSRHEDFACRRRRLEIRRPLRRNRISALKIVSRYARSFFSEHLRGEKSDLLDGAAAPYPQVRLQSWPRASGNSPGL